MSKIQLVELSIHNHTFPVAISLHDDDDEDVRVRSALDELTVDDQQPTRAKSASKTKVKNSSRFVS